MIKQIGTFGQYVSDMIHDRFQIMESTISGGKYYIVVHDDSYPDGFNLWPRIDDLKLFSSVEEAAQQVEKLAVGDTGKKQQKTTVKKPEKTPVQKPVMATRVPPPVEKTKVQFDINKFRMAFKGIKK